MENLIEKVLSNQKLTPNEEKKLKDGIEKNLENEYLKLGEIKEARLYVSFFSFTAVPKYDISAIDKSLNGLKKVERCIFLVTEETKKEAERFERELKRKYPKIKKVVIEEIKKDEFNDIYSKLDRIIEKERVIENLYGEENLIKKEEIVIDNTLGLRMITGVFYRFCIEQGVKLISWDSDYKKLEKGFSRIPMSDRLVTVEFPQLKNITNLTYMNKAIDRFRFSEASLFLKSINNNERGEILEDLNIIFDINDMIGLNRGQFTENLESFINKDRRYMNKEIGEIFKKFKSLFEKILGLEEEKLEEVYICIVYKYIQEYFKDMEDGELKNIFINNFSKYMKDLKQEIVNKEFWKNYSEMIDDLKNNENTEICDEAEEILKNIESLKIDIPKRIEIKDRKILHLKKFEKDIKLDRKFTQKGANQDILKTLIESYELSKEQVEEVIRKRNNTEKEITSKQFYDLKNFILRFNFLVKEFLKSNKIDVNEDMISLGEEDVNLNSFKKIKIEDEYI